MGESSGASGLSVTGNADGSSDFTFLGHSGVAHGHDHMVRARADIGGRRNRYHSLAGSPPPAWRNRRLTSRHGKRGVGERIVGVAKLVFTCSLDPALTFRAFAPMRAIGLVEATTRTVTPACTVPE